MSQRPRPGPTAQPSGPGGWPPRRRSKGLLVAIVVGVLVVIGGGVAATILLLGGDDDPKPSTTSPLDTAESFEQAWKGEWLIQELNVDTSS